MGKGFLDYDAVTTNDLLRTVKENKNRFPLDSDLNEFSEKLLPNSVISREINKIKDATSNNKGYFLNVESLKDAYPTTNEGSKAYVGNSYPYMIYLFQGGEWINSGQAGGDDTFNAGDFYTKLQIDQQREVINGEISRVENGANYEVLEYEINIATTRLKVDEKNRKGGYMITYNPGTGWIKEQYIGLSVTNEEWIKDENWKAEVLDENIQAIAENAQQQANLAATNAALAEEKANEAATQAAYAKEQGDRLSNIDLSLYRVVLELPSIDEMTEDDMNKIYLMVSAKQGETNKYDEYICVDGEWELLGQYEAAIDLTAYVGKDELKNEIATLDKLDEISKFVCIDKNGESAGVMTKEQVASVLAGIVGVVLFSFEINFSNSENGGGTIDDRYTYKFPGVEFSISDYTTSRFKVNHNIASRKYSISITKLNQAFNGQEGEPTAEVYYAENSESSFYITSGEGKNPANILVTVFGIK